MFSAAAHDEDADEIQALKKRVADLRFENDVITWTLKGYKHAPDAFRLRKQLVRLDRIAGDLQHLCDQQAIKLAELEAQLQASDTNSVISSGHPEDAGFEFWRSLHMPDAPQHTAVEAWHAAQPSLSDAERADVQSAYQRGYLNGMSKGRSDQLDDVRAAAPQPPQEVPSQWVGLADAITEVLNQARCHESRLVGNGELSQRIVRAIESALRQKNACAQDRQPLTSEQISNLLGQVAGTQRSYDPAHGIGGEE
jgi:hypothetical protein